MTKVHAAGSHPFLRCEVLPDVLQAKVLDVVPVRRPLDVPSTLTKFGKVLSHSGCVARTEKGFVMIEYMSTNQVYITRVYHFTPGCKEFNTKKYHFILDNPTPQVPVVPVTVGEFANKMVEYTKDKEFNTFTHNCHHARYDTMKYYGMISDNPDAGEYNIFYQGFVDYFSRKTK